LKPCDAGKTGDRVSILASKAGGVVGPLEPKQAARLVSATNGRDIVLPDGSEAALADAFREMEGKVSDARAAALVLEALMEKTIAERPQHRSQVVQLTEDEATGLFFAAQHLGDLVRALHDEYRSRFAAAADRPRKVA